MAGQRAPRFLYQAEGGDPHSCQSPAEGPGEVPSGGLLMHKASSPIAERQSGLSGPRQHFCFVLFFLMPAEPGSNLRGQGGSLPAQHPPQATSPQSQSCTASSHSPPSVTGDVGSTRMPVGSPLSCPYPLLPSPPRILICSLDPHSLYLTLSFKSSQPGSISLWPLTRRESEAQKE